MTHQPSGGVQGQATDIEIHAKEIINLKKKLNLIYEKHTGQSLNVIEKMMERDYFMSADEAKKTGIVDKVVSERPDFEKNYSNLKTNFQYIDNFFISTHPDDVSKKNPHIRYNFLPTPVDRNIEKLNIYKSNNYTYDVFFAMSHGVNRGKVKSGKKDERENFIRELISLNKDVKFDIYGYKDRNPVWSESFYSAISRSSMAVNLNRGKPKKYSSSNRIGSLIGNGLLTFIDYKKKFNHFSSLISYYISLLYFPPV